MSDLKDCNIDATGAFDGCLPNINIQSPDGQVRQLENLSQDTHQHIVSYMTQDRDIGDEGLIYDRGSFEDQLNNSDPTTLMIREIDMSMKAQNLEVTPDGSAPSPMP